MPSAVSGPTTGIIDAPPRSPGETAESVGGGVMPGEPVAVGATVCVGVGCGDGVVVGVGVTGGEGDTDGIGADGDGDGDGVSPITVTASSARHTPSAATPVTIQSPTSSGSTRQPHIASPNAWAVAGGASERKVAPHESEGGGSDRPQVRARRAVAWFHGVRSHATAGPAAACSAARPASTMGGR